MRLVLQDIARVSSAQIDLGGITVIAGANGTGKSTISRSLMTLASVSRRILKLVQSERMESILGALRESFGKYGANVFFDVQKGDWLQWLSKDWWDNAENVIAWFRNGHSSAIYPRDFLDKPQCVEAVNDAKAKVLEAIDRDEVTYAAHVLKKTFKYAFNDQTKPVFKEETASQISITNENAEAIVEFSKGELNRFSGIGHSFFSSVAYFEPISYIDFVNVWEEPYPIQDRYSAGRLCACRAISNQPPKDLSFEDQAELDEASAIVKDLIGIIHGRLVDDNQDIRFSEKFADDNHLIDVKNIASGMKTMAAIVRAVENRSIRRGSMLIIDEPESNLHPEWQVKFARFLVLLAKKLGISLLLNTHSPYFLQALRVISRQVEVGSRFYNMVQDEDGVSYHTEDVSDNLESVFETMSKPFNDLMVQ